MTTYIDFRYARTLTSALLSSQPEELEIAINPTEDNYMALEFTPAPCPRELFELITSEGIVKGSVLLDTDFSLKFQLGNGKFLLSTPNLSFHATNGIFAFRLCPDFIGFKTNGSVYEKENAYHFDRNETLFLRLNDDKGFIKLMGRGSGLAHRWAKLYYNRMEPDDLGVELVFDWHHLRSGIPLSSTLITEKLIHQTNFRLAFNSYILDDDEAQVTDFARLFSNKVNSDISVHMTPPIYTRFNAHAPNIGFFVYESTSVPQGIVNRCNLMDSIVVPSSFASIAFKKAGVHKPIHVVHHGVDTEFYRPVFQRRPLPGGRGFNFLAVSTHLQRKNIRPLVRAFLEEFGETEDVSLFLLLRPEFGTTQNNVAIEFDEWEKSYFNRSAPVFLWTGYVTRDTLRDFYANANVYVLPSNEGFGLTLLEAMASGTPAIALKYGGVLDFINEENGYLVPTGRSFIANDMIEYTGDRFFEPDVSELRSAMRYVFENRKEASTKGLKARKDCEENYTWDKAAIELSEVIKKTYEFRKEQSIKTLESEDLKRQKLPTLSWVLCVPDDMPMTRAVRHLKKVKNDNEEVLCLFTRYARYEDIISARKNRFLFHRWDGSNANLRAIIKSTILTDWAGILYANEEIAGNAELLLDYLKMQPKEVCEVLVRCHDHTYEPRFLRSQLPEGRHEQKTFRGINVFIP